MMSIRDAAIGSCFIDDIAKCVKRFLLISCFQRYHTFAEKRAKFRGTCQHTNASSSEIRTHHDLVRSVEIEVTDRVAI
jgi:hypothetical protein